MLQSHPYTANVMVVLNNYDQPLLFYGKWLPQTLRNSQ